MKKISVSDHKAACYRQRCLGAINDKDNYLQLDQRIVKKSKHKQIMNKKSNSKDKNRNLLEQQYKHAKFENEKLLKKIEIKDKIIRKFQQQLKQFDGAQKSKIESEIMIEHALEKIKSLQKDHKQYKCHIRQQMAKLLNHNQEIGKIYQFDQQLNQLKKQVRQIDKNKSQSTKILRYQPSSNSEVMKEHIKHLQIQLLSARQTLAQKESEWSLKEHELKRNLLSINTKVEKWQKEFNLVQNQCNVWEEKYNVMLKKYKSKRDKYRINNQQWAKIFRDFMEEIERLKQQLNEASNRNLKLSKLCIPQQGK